MKPTIGRIVLYRTDGRNGLIYDLPAIVTCTRASHPGDYPPVPDDPERRLPKKNPLPVPESDTHVHLTVFSPGGFGSAPTLGGRRIADWMQATGFDPGSGTYVELNVPMAPESSLIEGAVMMPRSWRWPVIERD